MRKRLAALLPLLVLLVFTGCTASPNAETQKASSSSTVAIQEDKENLEELSTMTTAEERFVLSSIKFNDTTTYYEYDENGQVSAWYEMEKDGSAGSYCALYDYNNEGQLLRVEKRGIDQFDVATNTIKPSSHVFESKDFEYDASGGLVSKTVHDNSGGTETTEYEDGNIIRITIDNGTATETDEYVNDEYGNPTAVNKVRVSSSDGSLIWDGAENGMNEEHVYKYDSDGNMTSDGWFEYTYENGLLVRKERIERPIGSFDSNPIGEYTLFSYDSNGRIISEVSYSPKGEEEKIVTYTYDSNGNLLQILSTGSIPEEVRPDDLPDGVIEYSQARYYTDVSTVNADAPATVATPKN